MLATAVGVGALLAFVPPERYRATATLLVEPASKETDFSDIEALRFLLPAMVEQVDTVAFNRAVRGTLVPPASTADIDLVASSEPGTGLFRVTTEGVDQEAVAPFANAAARQLIRQKISPRLAMSVLEPAARPGAPAGPLKIPILLGSAALGLIGALFCVLIANALRRQIKSSDEMRERFGLEVLAEIPQTRHFPGTTVELFNGAGDPRLLEGFQRLRTNLELIGQDNASITVTSCGPGDGKSTVTAALAWTFASVGGQVLAIDCDLRRPMLHGYLGVELSKGIGDLANGADLGRLLQKTDLASLSVVSAGTTDKHPTEVVQTYFPKLLELYSDRLVLVDTPPVLGVAEATLIATMTSGVLLVVDARRGDPAELEEVLHELTRAGANVLGVVVNHAKISGTRASAYYGY